MMWTFKCFQIWTIFCCIFLRVLLWKEEVSPRDFPESNRQYAFLLCPSRYTKPVYLKMFYPYQSINLSKQCLPLYFNSKKLFCQIYINIDDLCSVAFNNHVIIKEGMGCLLQMEHQMLCSVIRMHQQSQ